ncbi:hypothetical protein [Cochleicola gelatinilyticus]|nr:hypothetical protein [Cochleicola gelatinilyticus]
MMKIAIKLGSLLMLGLMMYGCSSKDDITTNNENLLFGKWTQPVETACPTIPTIFFGKNKTFSWNIPETSNCEDSNLSEVQVSGTYEVSEERLMLAVENFRTVNAEDTPFQFNENTTFSANIEYLTEQSLQFKVFLNGDNASENDNTFTFLFSRTR